MTRVAIYARMSTDKQSADSPADQVARCGDFAAARGWSVLEDLVVTDAGVSGASRHNRPGLLELMQRIAEWDVLLCWDSSRLARDSEDLGWIRNRLRAHKRTGYEVSTGLELFNVGSKVMGVIAEEYLVKLRADTHRGLRGRAERGLAAGGTPYGYRTEEIPSGKVDPHGRSIPAGFRLVVDGERAAVVRRIFELYASGEGLRAIAHRLNAERIPSPRPRAMKGLAAAWSPSALRAMLLNPIYRGEYVWNRSEWVKDHETGRRRRFERPEGEWVRQELAELAIVPPEVWERVRAVREAKRCAYQRTEGGQLVSTLAGRGHRSRGRHALAGFLSCAECGGGFFDVHGRDLLGCAWRRDRGTDVCGNDLRVPRAELEARVFGAILERILLPENVLYAVEHAMGLVRARREAPRSLGAAQEARLAEIAEETATLRRVATKTGRAESIAALLAELEEERAAILAAGARGLRPRDLGEIRRRVEAAVLEMRRAFDAAPDRRRTALGALLAGRRMRVGPEPERGYRVEGLFELALDAGPARDLEGRRAGRVCGSGGGI